DGHPHCCMRASAFPHVLWGLFGLTAACGGGTSTPLPSPPPPRKRLTQASGAVPSARRVVRGNGCRIHPDRPPNVAVGIREVAGVHETEILGRTNVRRAAICGGRLVHRIDCLAPVA